MLKPLLSPIQRFIKAESAGGFLLFFATISALLLSNWAATSDLYLGVLQYKIGFSIGDFHLIKPLILWINDGLMAIFFFLIGLEIKREITLGELNSLKKASLPIFAAVGGMVVPFLFYVFLNENPATKDGWGIVMATDIAFTLAILQLLGKRVPLSLKIFLMAFAIIDDIGAVLVIALFYTSNVSWMLLLYAGILLALLYVLSYFKYFNKMLLLVFGIVIWVLFLKSGIHPTVAGILLAFAVPVSQRLCIDDYSSQVHEVLDVLGDHNDREKPILSHKQINELDRLDDLTRKFQSPVQELEHRLHLWVAYFVMPVFALANAGISFSTDATIDYNLVWTIVLSLVLGKALGVSLFSFISIKIKLAFLPENMQLKQLIGVAILSGVGFTMSLFIAGLAFSDIPDYLNSAKVGIIIASFIAGLIGYMIIRISLVKK